jgi:hypothetical protein
MRQATLRKVTAGHPILRVAPDHRPLALVSRKPARSRPAPTILALSLHTAAISTTTLACLKADLTRAYHAEIKARRFPAAMAHMRALVDVERALLARRQAALPGRDRA